MICNYRTRYQSKATSKMSNYIAPQDQEQQIKKLKRLLEGWRMALLPLKSIILWEQQWYPCAIFGFVSFLYFLIWLMDLNSLATFAFVGLIFNFIDFMVPLVCNAIYGTAAWTGQKEKIFEDICKNIVESYNNTFYNIRTFYSLRESNPCVYYIISISMLCMLSWIASSINNIFLLYLLTTVMLLWPGLQRTRIFNSLLSFVNLAPKITYFKSE